MPPSQVLIHHLRDMRTNNDGLRYFNKLTERGLIVSHSSKNSGFTPSLDNVIYVCWINIHKNTPTSTTMRDYGWNCKNNLTSRRSPYPIKLLLDWHSYPDAVHFHQYKTTLLSKRKRGVSGPDLVFAGLVDGAHSDIYSSVATHVVCFSLSVGWDTQFEIFWHFIPNSGIVQHNLFIPIFTTRVCGKVMFLVMSVCLSVCLSVYLYVCLSVFLSVQAITFEPLDIETSCLVCSYILTISRSGLSIKVIGSRSRSYEKNDSFTYFNLLILCMWLQVINKVKVTSRSN